MREASPSCRAFAPSSARSLRRRISLRDRDLTSMDLGRFADTQAHPVGID